MSKSMSSAYTDMMSNLAKSTAAVPLHLQKATEALAWWEGNDSLLAKSAIAAPADEPGGDKPEPRLPKYNKDAVDAAIAASNRSGRKISKKGATLIHRLLAGGHQAGEMYKSLDELVDAAAEVLAKGSVANKMRGVREEGRNFEAGTAKELRETLNTEDATRYHSKWTEDTRNAVKANKKQKLTATGREKADADENHEWNRGRLEGLRDNPVRKAITLLEDLAEKLEKASAENESDEAYEEDAEHDGRPHPDAANDVHGGHEADEAHQEPDGDDLGEGEGEGEEMTKSCGCTAGHVCNCDMTKAIGGLMDLAKSLTER
jgi:hypothetical protein